MIPQPASSHPFPYTALFRSFDLTGNVKMTFPSQLGAMFGQSGTSAGSLALDMTGNGEAQFPDRYHATINAKLAALDRKSTRLNSSHSQISYAVFCLQKKKH